MSLEALRGVASQLRRPLVSVRATSARGRSNGSELNCAPGRRRNLREPSLVQDCTRRWDATRVRSVYETCVGDSCDNFYEYSNAGYDAQSALWLTLSGAAQENLSRDLQVFLHKEEPVAALVGETFDDFVAHQEISLNNAVLNNAAWRIAISCVIDRDEVARIAADFGFADSVPIATIFNPGWPGFNESVQPYGPNSEECKHIFGD